MRIFRPQWEALPAKQRELWPQLHPIGALNFVLYGGTAIALQLGHRQSIDFDFFTNAIFRQDDLRAALPFLQHSQVIQDERNTLSVLSSTGVKISFFGGLPFGRYGDLGITDDQVLTVASLDDLMALKLKVILQRSELKDYLDLAAMLESGASLEKGLAIAEHMFRPELSPAIALKALTYFAEGDVVELPSSGRDILVRAVEKVTTLPLSIPLSPFLHQ